jgi:hypothetical protein
MKKERRRRRRRNSVRQASIACSHLQLLIGKLFLAI